MEYAQELAKIMLGEGINDHDAVEGAAVELLDDEKLQQVFKQDLGFELRTLLQALSVLSQPVRYGLED
ncbi:hypothetical protein [Acidovorax sp. A1169]|uniref:hypothetical protein n=1 Tax=Acidovorax sp. A1169 TaxID=3059524 RepID=UPI002737BBFF|nr:hypothetical protein [Acidovorax sp. A1169]MDP4077637.1 hypothetical protein [Acidovorax sp. A1169]